MRICPDCASEYQGSEQFCHTDGARLVTSDDDPLIGRQIGSYRLARMLGQGGMGQVYLGVHPGIGSRVAVKLLGDDAARRPDLVERFFAEATAVNRIRHENIVNVLDLDRLDGRPYIVMEFLEGRPLSSVIAHFGRLPLGTLAQLAKEILAALDAAHRAGIIHRDLKPDNVFVSPQGRAKVLDFGIAKLLPESGGGLASFTQTGMVLGTPSYMSPEQVMGAAVTPATDIYALGTILYECATGRVPFQGSSLYELLHHQVHTPPPPPRALRPDLPSDLEALILRALAKDPAARFAGAADMGAALTAATMNLPAEAWASISLAGPEPALVAQPTPTPHPPTQVAPTPSPPVAETRQSNTGRALVTVAVIGAVAAVTAVVIATASDPSPEVAATATTDASADSSPAPAQAPTQTQTQTQTPAQTPTPTQTPTRSAAPAPKRTRTQPAEPGVKRIGSVTIINTAEQAKAATGLKPIERSAGNTARFDAVKFLPRAEEMAKALMPDAILVHWEVDGVAPSGLANLDIADHEATYRFRSPARSSRPADIPRGVEVDIPCMVYVDVSRGRARAYPTTDETCKDKRRPRPRCTLAQVWQRAYDRGAPKGNWVASIDYLWDGWFINITNGKGDGSDFTESIPDDC